MAAVKWDCRQTEMQADSQTLADSPTLVQTQAEKQRVWGIHPIWSDCLWNLLCVVVCIANWRKVYVVVEVDGWWNAELCHKETHLSTTKHLYVYKSNSRVSSLGGMSVFALCHCQTINCWCLLAGTNAGQHSTYIYCLSLRRLSQSIANSFLIHTHQSAELCFYWLKAIVC